jgi:hypothetical protein
MLPITTPKMPNGGSRSVDAFSLALSVEGAARSPLKPGYISIATAMMSMNIAVSIRPGTMPATNSCPMDVLVNAA